MKRMLAAALAITLCAASALAGSGPQESVLDQITLGLGASFASAGSSPLEEKDFSDDFDTGFSWNLSAVGPIYDRFGWRAEIGHENLAADADRAGGRIEGDYTLFRFQLGLQYTNFDSDSRGRPYFFVTMGLAHQDAKAESETEAGTVILEFDGTSNFGMSFGGGYDYLIRDNWGVGGDLHLNVGFFDDDTRMWWTPSVQGFYRW